MNIEFDTEKLGLILNAFYSLTNVTITLFNRNLEPVCSGNASEYTDYCLAIGEDESRLKACEACNRENAKKSEKCTEPWIYTCHAGIAEAVTPIRIDGQLVAYLMMGKFRDCDKFYSSEELVKDTADKYKLAIDYMLSAYAELPMLDATSIEYVKAVFNAIICYIRDSGAISIGTPMSKAIEKYINEHFREKITIQALCREFCINRSSLCELLKKNLNDTLVGYINAKRIAHAEHLLLNTDMSLQEIIADTGIQSYQYFYKIFKKKTGMSMEQYRKQNKK